MRIFFCRQVGRVLDCVDFSVVIHIYILQSFLVKVKGNIFKTIKGNILKTIHQRMSVTL